MAAPPDYTQFLEEDFRDAPPEIQAALAKAFFQLNPFLAQSTDAMRDLTITDNFRARWLDFSVTAKGDGAGPTDTTIATVEAEVQTVSDNLAAHVDDTSDAHDASTISLSAISGLSATQVQAGVAELKASIDTLATDGTRVYVRAHANVAQNFTRDAALAPKNFTDERVDTHNQWSGSRFTCSQPGVYSIQACIGWSTSSFVDDTDLGAMDLVSNIGTYRGPKLPAKGGVLRLYHHILLPMGVGDWVEAHTGHTAGGLGAVLTTSSDTGENWIMIARVSV